MLACCGFGLLGGLMAAILIMKKMQEKKAQERTNELVSKAEEGTINTEEAAELARNPPISKDQTIEAEIDRYGPEYRPIVKNLVEEFRDKKIDYIEFITELNKIRNKALKDKQYSI